jgi:hypothetical protein
MKQMKPNSTTQTDKNMKFNGQEQETNGRLSKDYGYNQFGGQQNPNKTFNEGLGPRKGNQDFKPKQLTPGVTKDKFRAAPTDAMPGYNLGQEMYPGAKNPQQRTPSGTRAWQPQAGQNYRGNPDKINVSNYSMGDGVVQTGKNPQQEASTKVDFNFGPKSQY